MPQETQRCVVCDEAITNPICKECLGHEMEQWLLTEDPALADAVRDIIGLFDSYTHEGTICVICGNSMRICSHCVCSEVYTWLKDVACDRAERFLIGFDYELTSPPID